MPDRARLAATRRTTLGGAGVGVGVAVAAVAGCDLDRPSSEPAPSGAPASATPASTDPDTVLVGEARHELDELSDLVAAVRARFPRLGEPMGALHDLHLAHLRALDDPSAATSAGRTTGRTTDRLVGGLRGAAEALALVHGRERRLQGRLADLALAARSGALARLLASMSAGVAQRLALLPSSPAARR